MTKEEEIENFIYIQSLENAVSFNGKANPKAIIGKVIAKFPEIKKDMTHYMNTINNISSQTNLLSLEEQRSKLEELNPKFFKKTKEEKKPKEKILLPELKNVEDKVRTRFEPAPSGHLHIGHLYSIVPNLEYAKKYNGDFILRIGDTNPDNIKIENYDKVIEDVKWIADGLNIEIYYQSDRLELYYEYLEKLIANGSAYVCFCESEKFKEYNDNSLPSPYRDIKIDEQKKRFEDMISNKFKPGEAVIRFKGDLENKNPALRDFTLARINDTPHARRKDNKTLWPTMNLTVAVDDIEMKLTHIIRGKDHEINMLRQKMIHESLNLNSPEYLHLGRVKFTDLNLSKTKLSEEIKQGIYSGWDDPRIPSLLSFKKRGYKAKAFNQMILEMGAVSKRDSKISYEEYLKNLNFFNKQILEKESDRFFFISEPIKITIKNFNDIEEKQIIHPKHPENKSRGNRVFELKPSYYIEKKDFERLNQNDIVRLMHFGNFKILAKENLELNIEFISKDYSKEIDFKSNIHFIPIDNNEECEIIMPDNSKIQGISEHVGNIKESTSIQFERFGFVKFDNKIKDKKVYYFTHK